MGIWPNFIFCNLLLNQGPPYPWGANRQQFSLGNSVLFPGNGGGGFYYYKWSFRDPNFRHLVCSTNPHFLGANQLIQPEGCWHGWHTGIPVGFNHCFIFGISFRGLGSHPTVDRTRWSECCSLSRSWHKTAKHTRYSSLPRKVGQQRSVMLGKHVII